MRIALIGYGKMGKAIDRLALENGDEIVARIDPSAPEATARELNQKAVEKAEVCIEFTHPDQVVGNIKKLASFGKPVVIGTTGWGKQIDDVRELLVQNQVGALWSENFSIGMQFFMKLVEEAAKLSKTLPGYDVGAFEVHHKEKKDAPSGTAMELGRIVGTDFSSVRCGAVPGTHEIFFDSLHDTIRLSHQARNREGFAKGALTGAHWIVGKVGLYHLKEIF